MNDRELTKLLRGLPRTSASPRFTSDVLRAVRTSGAEAEKPAVTFRWRAAAAFAMAVCLVIVVQAAFVQHVRQQRLAALRAETQRIEADLEAVKALAGDFEPRVVLEHADGTRVVVESEPQQSAVVPASYTID